jgi:farnesyl diphosphate synthase
MSTSTGEKRQNGDAAPPAAPAAPQPSNDKAARRKRFEDVFPVIVDELTGYLQAESMPKDAVEWYKNVSGVARPVTAEMFRWGERREGSKRKLS